MVLTAGIAWFRAARGPEERRVGVWEWDPDVGKRKWGSILDGRYPTVSPHERPSLI